MPVTGTVLSDLEIATGGRLLFGRGGLNAGAMRGLGTTTIGAGASAVFDGVTSIAGTRVVRNEGTLTVAAGSTVSPTGGSLVNAGSMTVAGDWTLDAGFAVPSPFAFTNTGALDKTGGAGQSLVAADVALGGTVRVRTGTLRFAQRAATARSQSADVTVDAGAAVDLMNGAFPFAAGSVTGGGTLRTTSATVDLPARVAIDTLAPAGRLLRFHGDATVPHLTVGDDAVAGTGTITIPAGGTASLGGHLDDVDLDVAAGGKLLLGASGHSGGAMGGAGRPRSGRARPRSSTASPRSPAPGSSATSGR